MKTNNLFRSIFLFGALMPRESSCFDRSDFLVSGLGEIEPAFNHFDGTMYSGLLPIDVDFDGDPRGELSFWFFNPDKKKDSLTIWLNGGPGCSSYAAGLFMELGPVTYPSHPAGHGRTTGHEPLGPNKYSWVEATNLVFVEHPIGIGFSYGDEELNNEADISSDFYNFLVNFLATFEDMSDKPLYIVGESYAGMYVPSIAHFIHTQNKKGTKRINLSGIALGNGWIDAMTQAPAVIDYAYWHGMIDSQSKDILMKGLEQCHTEKHMKAPFHDFTTPDDCGTTANVLNLAGLNVFPETDYYAPNQYDVTTWDNYPLLHMLDTPSSRFLNNPEVRKIMHFEKGQSPWVACIPGAGRRRGLEETEELPGQILLAHDQPESVAPYIAELLDDADIRVLLYAGDRDLSVNLQGSEQVLNKMTWSGEKNWKASDRFLWMIDGDVAGYVKTHKNLDLLMVLNSGHLVPYNVPVSGLDLINRLTGNIPFGDIILPKLEMSDEDTKSEWVTEGLKAKLPILAAVLCFAIGVFVGSRLNRRPSSEYQEIVDMT